MREVFFEKRHKYFLRAGLEKKWMGRHRSCFCFCCRTYNTLQVRRRIGDAGQDRGAVDAGVNARLNKFLYGLKAQIRTRRPRLQDTCKVSVGCGYGNVDAETVLERNRAQQIQIA